MSKFVQTLTEERKNVQKKSKKQKDNKTATKKRFSGVKLGVVCLLVLVLLLATGWTINLLSSFNKPLSPKLNADKSYTWDGNTATNIVVAKTKSPKDSYIYVVNFDPQEQKVTILKLPPSAYIELPKGYGYWRVGSIYALGQEDKDKIGAHLLKISLNKLLGMPIDGIILTDKAKDQKMEDFIANLRRNRLNVFSTLTGIETDLTFTEAFNLLWKMSNVRADKITQLDLEQSNITESKLLPDTSRVLSIDNIKLDLLIRDKLVDSNVLLEDKTVAVFNGTKQPGLTREAVRLVTNLGARVIIVSNTETPQETSSVFIGSDNDYQTLTAKRIMQIYAPGCITVKCISSDHKVVTSRAQINIVLGEDYYNYWFKR